MNKYFIVDVQFFRGNEKEIIIKSFSYCKLFNSENIVENYVFKPPYDYYNLNVIRRRHADYVTKNVHYMHWNDGFIEYNLCCSLFRKLLSEATEVYVKGLEKAKFINSILQRNVCVNIEIFDCPNLKTLKTATAIFNDTTVSSLNVTVLKKWLQQSFQYSMEFTNSAIQKFNEKGFYSLSERDIYFLPLSYLLYKCDQEFLIMHISKFPPHVVQNESFRNFVFKDDGYDEVDK